MHTSGVRKIERQHVDPNERKKTHLGSSQVPKVPKGSTRAPLGGQGLVTDVSGPPPSLPRRLEARPETVVPK